MARCSRSTVIEAMKRLVDRAAERGVTRAAIGLAWVAKHPAVTAPIVGTTKPHHLDDALASLELVLTDDEIRRLEAPYTPQPVQGH